MKDNKEIKATRPTLVQIENELKGLFGGVAVMMNECFYINSGTHMLGLSEAEGAQNAVDKIDLSKTNIGRYLPIYYAYAYEGRLVPGYEDEIENHGNNIEKLNDFAGIVVDDAAYFSLCLEVAGLNCPEDVGHLNDMLTRLRARSHLDSGLELHTSDLAVLSDMNERSVKNALNADGEGRLTLNGNGQVDNAEAKRWLLGRRGFKPTDKRAFPESLDECPDQLDALEIPAFVQHRIEQRFAENGLEQIVLSTAASPNYDNCYTEFPEILLRVSKATDLSPESIQGAMQQPLRIRPEDCAKLAKAISVDPVWFTMQVMRALYPTQMDMLLNPRHYAADVAELKVEGNSVDVILTAAMIKHGYLDMPMHSKSLFPTDCFGTREKGDEGAAVTLRYGGQDVSTDIRVKSEQTISPRKRFAAWFQKDLTAAPGDRIRLTKVDARVFELAHLPK